ncbi:hypothetical protein [Erythrobacter sp.]|uniref:beta strand repeat-containing protein n=1 Tax=Erythrobacter sp. TaxID=1042 RepID=UPI001425E9DD|nr:hypothetical protein [Erythrobacter sp.]QIQ85378.1 MAG: hypothetical protein G9473_00785 [Erythrobacter sp.]
MASMTSNRARLMLGCGGAALALSLTLASEKAQAQAFQATESVVQGSATRIVTGTNSETIQVETPTAVIDWTPDEDNAGNALDFLPTGATATFTNNGSSNPGADFAVLNRILPAANGNITVFDGTVISRIVDLANGTSVPGGTVAFYSPTGILVGGNASFDVGNLILTTLDPDPASFDAFTTAAGTLVLDAGDALDGRIQIDAGAQILASAENSYFAAVGAEVQVLGTTNVNGSQAYVAGSLVNLRFSNGLFDIEVPFGTALAGQVMELDGDIGGPSSTGAGDNHLIYAVAKASSNPISMLFSGNLGFAPAASAGIVNGEIILSANYDVFGRSVEGDSIDNPGATFEQAPDPFASPVAQADIRLEDFTSTSSLLAITPDNVEATAVGGASSVDGNLLLVGRRSAGLTASGQTFDITGDVLVTATNVGVASSSLPDPTVINAQGGNAFIDAGVGGVITIAGNADILARAVGGAEDINGEAGTATGGQALLSASGGEISILGNTVLDATAIGTNQASFLFTGATSTGGEARAFAFDGGLLSLGGSLLIDTSAIGASVDTSGTSTGSEAIGGFSSLDVTGSDGGTIEIASDVFIISDARGSDSNEAGAGALGQGGNAGIFIDGPGSVTIGGGVSQRANGTGGTNFGFGSGGEGRGGSARTFIPNGGTLDIGGGLTMLANALGGRGTTGGDAFGGAAGIEVVTGLATIANFVGASANATGGDADFGFGGNGGNAEGGLAFVQATGTLAASATIEAGGASATSTARGGRGGQGDSDFAPGRGGDATGGDFGTPNPVDPQFNNGAFVLAGGDNGNIIINGGDVGVIASAEGGEGGDGGSFRPGGEGGIGQGGLAQIGLSLLGLDGSVAQGSFDIAGAFVDADGVGGPGGNGDVQGTGGEGRGGFAAFTIRAGTASADVVQMFADGFGGDGEVSGAGIGGAAGILGSLGGVLTMNGAEFFAEGFGGGGNTGGAGNGGEAFIDLQGIDVTINGDLELNASGQGGDSFAEAGGTGTGGTAFIGIDGTTSGTGTVTGNAAIIANGEGGEGGEGLPGGDGVGGEAFIRAQAGGTVTLGSAQVTASGLGVSGPSNGAGNGTGGRAFIESFDAGSSVIIQNNTPADFFDVFNRGAIVAAVGIGGDATGGSGVAGVGTGGEVELLATAGGSIALPADPAADPNSNAENGIVARGFGGGSSIEGGTAGQGVGGVGTITADGGTITSGAITFSVFGVGGSGLDSTVDTFGGEGLGGVRAIQVRDGGEITAEFSGGISGGLGGDGTGVGTGGDASGGTTLVDVDGGTLNLVGRSVFVDQSRGGSGLAGGNATGGAVDFLVNNGTVNFTANAAGEALAIVGGDIFGGSGEEQGGSASGAVVLVQITGSTVSGGAFEIAANAFGGEATGTGGIGGDATAGDALLVANPSTISLVGQNVISARAAGGDGETAGSGTGGFASIDLLDSELTVAPDGNGVARITITAFGESGQGTIANGLGGGGTAQILLNNSTLASDEIELLASADAAASVTGASGGDAFAGLIEVIVETASTLSATTMVLDARALTNAGGSAFGGEALLLVGSADAGEQVDIANELTMLADASGDGNSVVGRFEVALTSGLIEAGAFTASALGDTIGDFGPSLVSAVGGDFLVSNTFRVDAFDDFSVEAGQGGLIGGPDLIDPTVTIDIETQGTLTFLGDDDNAIDFGGLSMALTSRDIVIEDGARLGAVSMIFTSLDTLNPAILGGTGTPGGVVTDEGYTLIAEELGRLDVGSFTFTQPVLPGAGTNDPDIILRDATVFGSADPDGGVSDVLIGTLGAGGIIRVDGLVEMINAAPTDIFTLEADERIEVVTPGGILIGDTDGLPTGELLLTANDIWVADATLIGQLQDDPSFAGRNDELAVAATGSDDPFGYLSAGRADFVFGNSLLVRNTGSDTEQGGITVGDGGLFLFGSETASGELDVFAYGRRQRPDGTFVLGSDFFSEVNFNINVGNTIYTDASEFNDCIINTGECPNAVTPPPVTPPPVEPPSFEEEISEVVAKTLNPSVIEEPAELPPEEIPLTEQESNDEFGVDFPGLIEAPLLSEDPLLDDPVASGGDSSAYGGGTAGRGLSGGPEGSDDE